MLRPALEPALGVHAAAASQLRALRGQLDEITCLLENQAPCPEILHHIFAAQSLLQETEHQLLSYHLRACFQSVEQVPSEAACRQILAEILELYSARRREAAAHR